MQTTVHLPLAPRLFVLCLASGPKSHEICATESRPHRAGTRPRRRGPNRPAPLADGLAQLARPCGAALILDPAARERGHGREALIGPASNRPCAPALSSGPADRPCTPALCTDPVHRPASNRRTSQRPNAGPARLWFCPIRSWAVLKRPIRSWTVL